MKPLRPPFMMLVPVVLIMLIGAVMPAHAGEITPNPNPSGNTITVTGSDDVGDSFINNGTININSGGTLTMKNWQRLESYGTMTNSGTLTTDTGSGPLWNYGTLSNESSGTLNNSSTNLSNIGTLTNNGTVNNLASLGSYGTFTNYGTLTNYPGAELTNYGTFTNYGTLTNYDWLGNSYWGTFTNYGTLNSPGWLSNSPYGTFNNQGTLNTSGTVFNYLHGTFNNQGTFNNSAVVYNWGAVYNWGTLTNSGTLANNSLGVMINTSGATLTNNSTLINSAGAALTNSGTLINNAAFTNSGTFTNTGTFTNNGAFTTTVTFTNQGTLKGSGTITGNVVNSGTIAPGNSIGTMTIAGSYTHSPGAIYALEIRPTGEYDNLTVTGNASINGGTVRLSVLAGPRTFNENARYTLLTAGSVTGTFASVTSSLTFLTPYLTYDPNHVYLLFARSATDFADEALTRNQVAVASAFDRVWLTASGDMETVMHNLLWLTPEEARSAFDQAGGLVHTALTGAVLSSFRRYLGTMADRMAGLSSGSPHISAASPFMLASAGPLLAALSDANTGEGPRFGLWMRTYGSLGYERGSDISSSYDYDTAGIAAGFDRLIGDRFLVGASLGYSYTRATMKDLSEDGRVSGYQGSLYGAYRTGPWYASGIMAYGYNRYDTSRSISFGDLSRAADADYTGHTLGGYLETGYRLTTPFADITPMVSLTGSLLQRGTFSESGANALDLHADSETDSSLVGSLGIRLNRACPVLSGTLTPEVRVRWDHEFMNGDHALSARFAGSSLSSFTVRSDRQDADSLALGFSLAWQAKGGLHLYLAYDGSFSGDTTEHSGTLGVRFRW